jgi:hypothetical protein
MVNKLEIAYCPSLPTHSTVINNRSNTNRPVGKIVGKEKSELENKPETYIMA